MKKKGVSPVIATVLLVGMVVVLGLIIFLWMKSFTKETITKLDGTNIELVCDDVNLVVSRAENQLTISNSGNVPVYDVQIDFKYAGSHNTTNARDFFSDDWPSSGLNNGEVFSGSDTSVASAESLIITPILIGSSESGSQKTYVCNEKRHGETAS